MLAAHRRLNAGRDLLVCIIEAPLQHIMFQNILTSLLILRHETGGTLRAERLSG
jgi:hypothetical protein